MWQAAKEKAFTWWKEWYSDQEKNPFVIYYSYLWKKYYSLAEFYEKIDEWICSRLIAEFEMSEWMREKKLAPKQKLREKKGNMIKTNVF